MLTSSVKTIPDGYHTVTPYLTVQEAPPVIEFLQRAFRAEVIGRTDGPDGSFRNAEIKIGNSMVMIGEARGEWQPMPCAIYLYVDDTDTVYRSALEAGASSLMEPADQFYGDRNAGVRDLAGNYWWIATHKEDVSHEEMARRMAAL